MLRSLVAPGKQGPADILRLRPCHRPLQQSVVSRFAVRLIEKCRLAGLKSLGNSAIAYICSSRFHLFCFTDLSISWGLGGPFFQHFGVLGHYFNTILVTIGCKGSLRRDLEWSRVEFYRFSVDLGSPIGDHSGSLFDILSDLKCPKSHLDRRHSFWWFLNWTSCDFSCPHLWKVQ